MSFTFNQVDGHTAPPFGPVNGFLITSDLPHDRASRATVNYTRSFGARAVNEFQVGFSRDRWYGPPTSAGQQFEPDLGVAFLNTSPDDPRTTGFPLFIIPGFSLFGGPAGSPFNFTTNIPQLSDNFSWSRGRHLFKTGAAIKARQFNVHQSIFSRGLLVFNALMTSNLGAGGNSLASALLGYPLVGQRDLMTPWGQRDREYGIYFQDDFKVSPRLTLNLGLRYDLFLPITEAYDRLANFDLTSKNLVLAGQNGLSRSTIEANTRNFGPHVGFAYAITNDQKTVLRGGYGISYLPLMSAALGSSQRLAMNPPFRNNFSTVFSFISPTVRVSDGLSIPAPDLKNPSGDINYIPPEQPFPYMQHWSFNIQRSLTANLLLDAAYAGSRGVHITGVVNLNQAPPGPNAPSTRAPISPLINNLTSLLNRESSFYHSLQVKLERRFAAGFYLLGAYTHSRSIDDGSYTAQASDASSVAPQDSRNWRAERGLSDFDVSHRLAVSYIYELPVGKGKRFPRSGNPWVSAVLGDWQINGITSLQSGAPFTPIVANPRTNAGPGGSVRPDRIGSGILPEGQQSIQKWFDKSAFVPQGTAGADPYHFGNSGRNILRGPGLISFDFSLFKNIPVKEGVRLQFRTEFFNLFNKPNFNLPDRSVDTAQGGVITSARDPRQIQFALKLVF
ncbi:MAG: TonB-dependent receptor [Acidobacteria bacterium]|nr:TonB-dependent receptor [Acidobacteriota bacterium]